METQLLSTSNFYFTQDTNCCLMVESTVFVTITGVTRGCRLTTNMGCKTLLAQTTIAVFFEDGLQPTALPHLSAATAQRLSPGKTQVICNK